MSVLTQKIEFGINDIKYIIEIQQKPTQSNFDKSVSVFKEGEKNPLFGSVFNQNKTQYEILLWAKAYAENLLKNPISLF